MKARIFIIFYFLLALIINGNTQGDCDCKEYIYLNDVFGDLTHKFLVNAPTGNLTQVGNPWLAANTIDNPHGIAADINGNLYIADGATGQIYKVSCEGTLLEPLPVIPNPFNGTELRTTNFFSRDGILYVVSESDEQILAFDLCDYSLVGRMDVDGGQDIQTWGFYIDGNNWYVPNRAAGNTNRMISGSLDMSLYTDPATNSGSTLFDFEDGMPVGMTIDSDGNFYVIEDQNGIATLDNIKINKYASDGTFITGLTTATNDGNNLTDGLEGWWGARGIVYSEATDQLYVSSQENCIAVFDTDLMQLETLNLGNPTGGNPKAIGIVTECCPAADDIEIDVALCNQKIGDKIFLQNITGCDGVICEGVWEEDAGNTGLTYHVCDNSVTIDQSGACGTFTLGGGSSACGPFVLTINIDVLEIESLMISGDAPTCANDNDPDAFTITSPASSSGTLTYQWQSSTTSCSSGFSDIQGAPTDGTPYDPPTVTQETYYRVILEVSGSCSTGTCEETSNCVTLTPEADCGPTCTLGISCMPQPQTSCDPTNGSASTVVSGVVGNISYLWSSGETTANISGKTAGTYTVTVTDDSLPNCTATCEAVITSTLSLPSLACSFTDNTSCTTPNGTVTATASNVSYAWSNGATTSMISNLASGTYTVTVTDLTTGCTNTCQAVVTTTTTVPTATCTPVANTNCATPNGSASVSTDASSATYEWSNNATTSSITGLSAGTYTVTVTNTTTGCTNTCQAVVTNATISPACSITTNSQPSCANLTGGSITVVPSPTGTYTYAWSDNGAATATRTGLTGGTYTVTLTNTTSSCTGVCNVTLDTPMNCCNIQAIVPQNLECLDNGTPALITDNRIRFSASVTNTNTSLTGYNVTINGGTTITPNTNVPYGVTQFTLGTGTAGGGATFTVTVTDSTTPGCTQIFQVVDPGNCTPSTPSCPPIKCVTATIQVNGN